MQQEIGQTEGQRQHGDDPKDRGNEGYLKNIHLFDPFTVAVQKPCCRIGHWRPEGQISGDDNQGHDNPRTQTIGEQNRHIRCNNIHEQKTCDHIVHKIGHDDSTDHN